MSLITSVHHSSKRDTFFAPPERLSADELNREITSIASNPFIDSLLKVMGGYFAVLNDKRQVVSINDAFLKFMGVDDPPSVLGLRPGEYVGCIHAAEMEGGCGTSSSCPTCGAVIAIMAALENHKSQQNTCALSVRRGDKIVDAYFDIRTTPVKAGDKWFVLFSLQDITLQQERASIDRSFFHDINNLLFALKGKSDMMMQSAASRDARMHELSSVISRISTEVSIHKSLRLSFEGVYKPFLTMTTTKALLEEQRSVFADNELSSGKDVSIRFFPPDEAIVTDFHLASRVITNMITNALEATKPKGGVELFVEHDFPYITFAVWNEEAMPEIVQKRIFTRNFSTKADSGRGFGTFSMKLFGERILGGKVSFSSSPQTGTVFRFSLPVSSINTPADKLSS